MGWDDLDLDGLTLTLRAGRKGAKHQRQDRVVPLHPRIAATMAGWGTRDGLVFTRAATKGPRRGQRIGLKGSDVAKVIKAAWERAEVDEAKWGDAGARRHARPTNAIRALFKSTIAGAASYDLATLMLGQAASHGEHDAYVAMGNPKASPYWTAMVKALETIPPIDPRPPVRNVVAMG